MLFHLENKRTSPFQSFEQGTALIERVRPFDQGASSWLHNSRDAIGGGRCEGPRPQHGLGNPVLLRPMVVSRYSILKELVTYVALSPVIGRVLGPEVTDRRSFEIEFPPAN